MKSKNLDGRKIGSSPDRWYLLIALAWTGVLALLLAWHTGNYAAEIGRIALNEGRAIVGEVESFLTWHANQGRFYVYPPSLEGGAQEESAWESSGAFWDEPGLVRVDPIYLVRIISEISSQQDLVKYSLHSINPVNPKNALTSHEKAALAGLEKDSAEHLDPLPVEDVEYYHYMKPITMREECVSCHEGEIGRVMGVVSVMIPKEPLDVAVLRDSILTSGIHGIIWFLGLLGLAAGRRTLSGYIRALQSSRKRYMSLFEHNQEPMLLFAPHTGSVADANPAACRFFGYDYETLISKTLRDLAASEERARDLPLEKGGSPISEAGQCLSRHVLADGEVRDVEISYGPIEIRGQNLVYAVLHDVTQRRKYQEELIRERDRAQKYLDVAGVVLLALDLDGKITLINQMGCELLGYDEQELLGSDWFAKCIPPEDRAGIKDFFDLIVSGKSDKKPTGQNNVLTRDGERRLVYWRSIVMTDEAGNIIGTLSSGEDITEQDQARRSLMQSEADLKAMFDNSLQSFVLLDKDLRFKAFNQRAAEQVQTLFRKNLEPGARIEDFLTGDTAKQINSFMARALSGELVIVEFPVRDHKGTEHWFELGFAPVRYESDEISGISISALDITDKKTAIQALAGSEAWFRSLVQNSSDLISIVDRSGRFSYVSPSAEIMLGYEKSELLGQDIFDFIHPHDIERFRTDFTTAAAEPGLRAGWEFRLRRSDGSWIYLETVSNNLLDDPAIGGLVLNARDISERKISEKAIEESERRYRAIFENTGTATILIENDRTISLANTQFEKLSGWPGQEVAGRMKWDRFFHPDDLPRMLTYHKLRRVTPDKVPRNYEARFISRQGEIKSAVLTVDLIPGTRQSIASIEDVTQRKKAAEALAEAEEKYRSIFENSLEGIFLCTLEGELISVNPAMAGIFGFETPHQLQAEVQKIGELLKTRSWDRDLAERIKDYEQVTGYELKTTRRDGKHIWVSINARLVRDGENKIRHIEGSLEDVTRRKQAEEELVHQAFHDPLTGLANKALLTDRLNQAMQRMKTRENYDFAVLYLDLDRFKVVNESLGHTLGDKLLIQCGERLSDCVTEADTVSRLSGDDFVILLDELDDPGDALRMAGKIQEAVSRKYELDGREVVTTSSIGIVFSKPEYKSPEEILRDADAAMYRAKSMGKSRYEVFDVQLHSQAVHLLQIENDLRRALENNEFVLFYQPIISLVTGKITGMEALIRWMHPERGMIPPGDFIPVAEETGLIIPIGEWVIKTACRQMRQWTVGPGGQNSLEMSVNLSAKQFSQPDLVDMVGDILKSVELKPSSLKLEITETVVMDDLQAARQILKGLKNLDVRLAIDDFGTGNSSLSYLPRFPVDTLKVDRTFTSHMSPQNENALIVNTIIKLAQDLNLDVVAEGVETREQHFLLREFKCNLAQGFYYSRPVDKDQARQMLETGRRW